jgi:alpha-D-ribose 1-methylphosphonate 5-triphosphate diphosphatase
MLKAEHRIHWRCETTSDVLPEWLLEFSEHPMSSMFSLMDHTPGQRQWRNLDNLKRYNLGSGEKTPEQHEEDVAVRMEVGPANMQKNWPLVVEMFGSRGIPIATHDDTTEDDVEAGVRSGAVISEFPTTVIAAEAAKRKGLATIMGAPNVVRGGSHSGGVSAAELAKLGLLDGLSSDYVPASLLQAVLKLNTDYGIAFADAMAKVTWKVADMVGLQDRGRLELGKRADILHFKAIGPTPVIRALWSSGKRAF